MNMKNFYKELYYNKRASIFLAAMSSSRSDDVTELLVCPSICLLVCLFICSSVPLFYFEALRPIQENIFGVEKIFGSKNLLIKLQRYQSKNKGMDNRRMNERTNERTEWHHHFLSCSSQLKSWKHFVKEVSWWMGLNASK